MIDELYSAKILKAAANMPRAGRLARPDGTAQKVSKLCGSRVVVDVKMAGDRIADYGQEVKACALGQAAAAIMGEHAIGASVDEIETALGALRAMLKEGAPAPEGRFADLAMLAPVKDYPPRHTSTMLAFEATAEACRRAIERRAKATGRTSRAGAA